MVDRTFHHGRHAGVLVPLFSIPSRASWGVGEIADLPLFARWLSAAGLDLVQLLPVNEMEEGQNSPYSALSAMAIDPVFIALRDVEEFAEAGGEAALDPADRARLEGARRRAAVDFRTVRALKRVALHLAFHVFRRTACGGDGARRRVPGLRGTRALVARRLRPVPCAARRTPRLLLAGLGARAARPRSARARSRAPAARRHHPLLPVSAVAGRHPVASRPPRVRPRRDLRRFSVHGQRAQRRRLGPAA